MKGTEGGLAGLSIPRYLVDAVLELGCLAHPVTLRQLVSRFGDTSHTVADLPQRVLVAQLLQDLCEKPEGLAPLIRNLELWEGDTPGMRRLKVAAVAWEVELLAPEDWEELFGLLDTVRLPDLHRQYSEFLLALGRGPAPAHCTEPWIVFLHAATLNCRPGEPLPCFQVTQQLLALGASGEAQLNLVEWVRAHQSVNEPAGRPEGEAAPAQAAKDAAQDPAGVWSPADYLIIRLRPLLAADTSGDTLLSYWWRLHPGEQRRGDDQRIELRHAEASVRVLLRRAEEEWAYALRNELALEFVLPRRWLHLSVENWAKTPFGPSAGLLGEDHQVVVRSMERIDRRDLHGRWGRRWEAFTAGRAGRVHWFPEDGRSHLLSEPTPAVVVLSGPAGGAAGPGAAEGEQLDELSEALRVGVPVILWDRREGRDPQFRSVLRALMDRHDVRDLPIVVRALRTASGTRDAEGRCVVGRHVALLWDDPDRMPVVAAGSPAAAEGEGEA
ncbi:hypothetical protein ACIF9R_10670 [Streptomyces sp. NPDC086080]|uniref:VMAP-C domain-containing protein n=1 Tax=Streptomyces sp. NPDC086080 TaxID=3365748 RepID=UPI0037D40121